MAETPSNMLPLGTEAPEFSLLDPAKDKEVSLSDIKSDTATVVMFICNHCPYVIHINEELVRFTTEYLRKGISFVAINSNDVKNYPQDSPENMVKFADKNGYKFPYLFDESQEIAKNYQAACTPDFYVFDKEMKLVYRGRFDDSTPGNNIDVTGKDLRVALQAILNGREIPEGQYPSVGCNIKWK